MAHVRSSAVACGMDDHQLNQIELSLEEILVNVISYAYPSNQKGDIEIRCSWDTQQGLVIGVTDSGVAFDPLAEPDPDTTLPLDELGIGGLGIFLTKKMMDKVTYERSHGKNILTMSKRCSK